MNILTYLYRVLYVAFAEWGVALAGVYVLTYDDEKLGRLVFLHATQALLCLFRQVYALQHLMELFLPYGLLVKGL